MLPRLDCFAPRKVGRRISQRRGLGNGRKLRWLMMLMLARLGLGDWKSQGGRTEVPHAEKGVSGTPRQASQPARMLAPCCTQRGGRHRLCPTLKQPVGAKTLPDNREPTPLFEIQINHKHSNISSSNSLLPRGVVAAAAAAAAILSSKEETVQISQFEKT